MSQKFQKGADPKRLIGEGKVRGGTEGAVKRRVIGLEYPVDRLARPRSH